MSSDLLATSLIYRNAPDDYKLADLAPDVRNTVLKSFSHCSVGHLEILQDTGAYWAELLIEEIKHSGAGEQGISQAITDKLLEHLDELNVVLENSYWDTNVFRLAPGLHIVLAGGTSSGGSTETFDLLVNIANILALAKEDDLDLKGYLGVWPTGTSSAPLLATTVPVELILESLSRSPNAEARLAVAQDPYLDLTAHQIDQLANDPDPRVSEAAAFRLLKVLS